MEDLDTFIRSKMTLIEDEMKSKYKDLLEHHREEQMALSPEDYTPDHGKVYIPVPKDHGGPPPIPEGSWAIEFQYLKWRSSDNYQHDYICVDNCGNEYTMRILQSSITIPPTNTGWVCSTDRKIPFTNSLIDLFKTDSWFTAKVVDDPSYIRSEQSIDYKMANELFGEPPTGGRYDHNLLRARQHFRIHGWGRNVNKSYVKVRDGRQINTNMTPLNINSLFLTALCKIAEDYNKRFIKYADLYKDGRLREYSGVVQELDDYKERTEGLEKELQEYQEREEQNQKEITDFKKTIVENECILEGLREINQELEETSEQFKSESLVHLGDYEKCRQDHEAYVKTMERKLRFYRKENERLVSEMDTMAPRDEVHILQKEIRQMRTRLKEAERFKDLYEKSLKSETKIIQAKDDDIQNIITKINEGDETS